MTARFSSRAKVPTSEQAERRRLRRQSRRDRGVTTSGVPGLVDHASNPWARKAAREGERSPDREGPR